MVNVSLFDQLQLDKIKSSLIEHYVRSSGLDRRKAFGSPLDDAELVTMVNHWVNDKNNYWAVGLDVDKKTGHNVPVVASAKLKINKDAKTADLTLLVDQYFRNKGHGFELIETALAAAKRAGMTSMFLTTTENNRPMQVLGEKFGTLLDRENGTDMIYEIKTGKV